MRFSTLVLVFSSVRAVFSVTVPSHTNLVIANQAVSPDGFNRSAVLAGTTEQSVTLPGPLITANKGDDFQVNVIDSLTDSNMVLSTSIHWHGLFQHGTNYDDGAVGINQCPISPGHSFLYKFSVPNQAGTYWYHSHDSTQYCDGLRGAIVIYDDQDPFKDLYDIDDESTVITLADWYHAFAPSLVLPLADSILINGKGRYAGGPAAPLSVVTVLPNKRYRFRLVSISCDPNFTFSIDGHNMTVIEVDGVNHQPLVVDSIQIFVGQRYSFILQTDMPISNYWMRANPNIGPTGFVGGMNSAILRYSGAPDADPVTTSSTTNPLLETNLHSVEEMGAPGIPTPGAADVNLHLNITFNGTLLEFFVNGVTFKLPSVPVLLQILSGAKTAQELLPSGSIFALPPNKVIEISMQSTAPGSPHPLHLHGHDFYVVRSAGSSVYNFANSVRRDVVNIGSPSDNVTIRFVTNNAGPWLLHCHIDWHLNIGLAVVLAEDIPTVMQLDPPDEWDQLCPIYNSTST